MEEFYRYEAALLASTAGQDVVKSSPKNMEDLEGYIIALKHNLSTIEQTEGKAQRESHS